MIFHHKSMCDGRHYSISWIHYRISPCTQSCIPRVQLIPILFLVHSTHSLVRGPVSPTFQPPFSHSTHITRTRAQLPKDSELYRLQSEQMLAMSKARFEMEMYEQQVKMQRMRMEAERAIQVCACRFFPTFQNIQIFPQMQIFLSLFIRI